MVPAKTTWSVGVLLTTKVASACVALSDPETDSLLEVPFTVVTST